MSIGRLRSLIAALVLTLAGLGATPATPVSAANTVEYPSPACPVNGDDGLQDCIDAAAPGDTIVLTSEINPDGAVVIKKSLTLRATDRTLQPQLPFIGIGATDTPVDVTVQDVRVRSRVAVGFATTPGGHEVTLRRLTVGKDDPNSDGITFDTQTSASLTIEGSYIRNHGGSGDNALHLFAEDPDGPVDIRVIGNRITARGNPESASGIQLAWIGDGSLRADILNNTIWDVGRCVCGAASGVSLEPSTTGGMAADVNIIGNTIERSATDAVQQRIGAGQVRLDLFNNIFSHIDGPAVRLDAGSGGALHFRAGHNDYYASGSNLPDGQSLGSGNRHDNPGYVDRATGNLKLRASSPLIDKGLVCSPGGVANLDAAGHGRLKGSSLDMGAYERDAGSPTGVARVGTGGANTLDGTSGDDILCGYAGNDTLRGKGGRDYLDGGSDNDLLVAGSGPDRSYGGSGKDTLCSNDGVHGNDRADGGSGTDKGRIDSGDTKVSIESSTSC